MRVHSLRWRLYWGARERMRDAVSRLTLPLANWYDARHPDVCRADIIPDLGLAYDLGRVLREGLGTFRGEAKRCMEDAERDGMCYCGKHVCEKRMAELAATDFGDDDDDERFVLSDEERARGEADIAAGDLTKAAWLVAAERMSKSAKQFFRDDAATTPEGHEAEPHTQGGTHAEA